MSVMRYLLPALFIALLSACDPEVKPAKVEPATSAVPEAQESKPKPPVAAQPQAAHQAPEPVPQPKAASVQREPAEPPLETPPKVPQAPVQAVPEPALAAKLDLSLPPELLEQVNAQGVAGEAAAPLLPPLFEEKATTHDPLQLSGRLITNEADADYWKSVEGAELQFEIKR
ncbi:hypothetical protein [Pseudomonas benzenivorans]|uniref:Translation initiation factor 2 n=1 Tax=Pseudomonas benzenivorans TaxID=556533 RepID=A0ABY5H7Q8_9PSED|nr:hypothetical protein [Pseudomonas benzenivorans]UTW08355.1 hypothetical protein KDW96_03240 [Pseudomonas benzenivorans]